eukprot:TRINITY_DN17441_c0_g1_i1.p1 TRINITY_DN17441_c0_g1~~TRINITY_DN17441_c0_g1_i1.p1  ORF type:complete len:312 (+),score=31.13 TRINITY_DN17441_c0_g1_i1:169-1104(+)
MNKEFTGRSFLFRPDKIVFPDFEVGRTYSQKVSVTNVSLSFNTFKVMDLSMGIRDFFRISYQRPGRMSAGTTCELTITFTPVLSTPISDSLGLLAETGEVRVPLIAFTRQCDIRVASHSLVDFEGLSVAETRSIRVTLENRGGLASDVNMSLLKYIDDDGVEHEASSAFHIPLTGQIGGHSTSYIEIKFAPQTMGVHRALLCFMFSAPNTPPIHLPLLGQSIDAPIYLEKTELDFQICQVGQLYRDTLAIANRGKIALKTVISVPSGLEDAIEFVPNVAFVQAHSKQRIAGTASSADLGGSSKYSNEKIED